MRSTPIPYTVSLLAALLLPACRVPLGGGPSEDATVSGPAVPSIPPAAPRLGDGAAPGNKDGAGGFVPRGAAKSFYAAAGGRLWYYVNCYYWASETAPLDDLWIKAEVIEEFQNLRSWPDGEAVAGPEPKVTVEYWRVGKTRRSVRLDNHKDFCLLSDGYSAGAIVVGVTLTQGHLRVRDARGRWGESREAYVLESRNYSGGGGIGAESARFVPLASEAVTEWGYRVPWSTHPQRVTRSSWQRLQPPTWSLEERHPPPLDPARDPVITPSED